MDEETEFEDDIAESETDDPVVALNYEAHIGRQRNDVRRKIEELLERRRLREEFGDLDDF